MAYKTRAHQIRAFERAVWAGKMSLRKALRSAAIAGAAEERVRTLELVRTGYWLEAGQLTALITNKTVMEVLGFVAKMARGRGEE